LLGLAGRRDHRHDDLSVARALVTGGTGFLGTHIADALAGAGYDVRVLDVRAPVERIEHQFVQADTRDGEALRRAAEGCEVVVDNAALVPVSGADFSQFRATNVDGCKNTLDAARAVGAYVVHVSSSSIYGRPRSLPVTEQTPLAPFEPYGVSKAEAELLVHREREAGLVISSLRSRALLGRGRLGLFELVFSRIRNNKPVPMFGRGNILLQMCDARDFGSAVTAAINVGANGDYNIGAGTFGTVRGDLQALINRLGSTSRLVPVPTLAIRAVMQPLRAIGRSPFTAWHWVASATAFYASLDKAREEMGWEPRYSNVDALENAYHHCMAGHAGTSPHSSRLAGTFARVLRGESWR
jgi:nucleoside-diphosphate-sugar epimerase